MTNQKSYERLVKEVENLSKANEDLRRINLNHEVQRNFDRERIKDLEDQVKSYQLQIQLCNTIPLVKHIEPAYQINRHNDLADEQAAINATALAAEEQNHETNFQTYK